MATVVPDEENVETQLTKIMSQNSGLMKQARTQGLQSAQSAGLGQSTMGIKAAQAAAYNAAVPLASQQASQGFQKGMQQAEFGQQTGMQQAGFGQESKLQQAGFGQESKMQEAQFGQQIGLQKSQFGHESGMQQAEFGHAANQAQLDRNLQNSLATAERASKEWLGTLDLQQQERISTANRQSQEWLTNVDMSNANKERAAASLSATSQTYAAGVAGIMSNPNLPADVRDSLLQQQEALRVHNTNLTRSLFQNF